MEHFQFVHREKRDIHGLLWKTCFYKQIEEYRHSIRGHSNKLNSLYAEQSMGMFKAKEIEFEQAYLNRLTLSFVQYLNDSVVFYQRLLSDVSRYMPILKCDQPNFTIVFIFPFPTLHYTTARGPVEHTREHWLDPRGGPWSIAVGISYGDDSAVAASVLLVLR